MSLPCRLSLASIEHEALEGVASKCRAAGSPEVNIAGDSFDLISGN